MGNARVDPAEGIRRCTMHGNAKDSEHGDSALFQCNSYGAFLTPEKVEEFERWLTRDLERLVDGWAHMAAPAASIGPLVGRVEEFR